MQIQTTKHHIPPRDYWIIARGDMRAVPVPIAKAPKVGDYLELYEAESPLAHPSSTRCQTTLVTHVLTSANTPAIAAGWALVSISRVEVHPKVERVASELPADIQISRDDLDNMITQVEKATAQEGGEHKGMKLMHELIKQAQRDTKGAFRQLG